MTKALKFLFLLALWAVTAWLFLALIQLDAVKKVNIGYTLLFT